MVRQEIEPREQRTGGQLHQPSIPSAWDAGSAPADLEEFIRLTGQLVKLTGILVMASGEVVFQKARRVAHKVVG